MKPATTPRENVSHVTVTQSAPRSLHMYFPSQSLQSFLLVVPSVFYQQLMCLSGFQWGTWKLQWLRTPGSARPHNNVRR